MATKFDPETMTAVDKDVKETFDVLIGEGLDTTTAAKYVLITHPKARKGFVEWLSEGKLTKVGKSIEEVDAA